MQATEAGAGKKSASGDEESINFRPSPNFKHMKKYLKSKFEEMSMKMSETQSEIEKQTKPAELTPVEEKPAQVEERPTQIKQEKIKPSPPPPTVQPPLPPNPPPPDSPPVIKEEIIDEEYNQYMNTANAMEDMMPQYTTEMPQPPPKGHEPTMCRNFVRGTCTKGPACIFVHELILNQLPGVYTFCRNFQNRQCTFARCKFVHATVFEKEYFYRTGYLPPHTLAHLKTQPPPPPPPEDPAVQQNVMQVQEMTQTYYPNMDMSGQTMEVADVNCGVVPNYMMQSPLQADNSMYGAGTSCGIAPSVSPTSVSPMKRDWATAMAASAMDEGLYTQTEMPPEDPMPKKCKDCDSSEFRYQFHKNKVENMISATDDLNKKMNQLSAKTQRMCIVLVTLFKPQSPMPGLGGMTAMGDKDKAILEQLNILLGTNTRMPLMNEDDNRKNLLGTSNLNFQNIMAQLLMHSGDQTGV